MIVVFVRATEEVAGSVNLHGVAQVGAEMAQLTRGEVPETSSFRGVVWGIGVALAVEITTIVCVEPEAEGVGVA